MDLERVKRETLPSKVAAKLRRDLFTGRYRPGEKFPAEREIAGHLGISRVTVRQALQELAREEWIEIVQGRGATVLDFSCKIGFDVLSTLLASCPQDVVTPETFRTMHDFSNWLYKQICISAAHRAGKIHKKKLLGIINEYKDGISVEDYLRIESSFYYELLSIGNDLILKMFFNTYIRIFRYLVESETLSVPPLPRDLYISFNTDLINAICKRETDQIDVILNKHKSDIFSALSRYLKTLGIIIDSSEQLKLEK